MARLQRQHSRVLHLYDLQTGSYICCFSLQFCPFDGVYVLRYPSIQGLLIRVPWNSSELQLHQLLNALGWTIQLLRPLLGLVPNRHHLDGPSIRELHPVGNHSLGWTGRLLPLAFNLGCVTIAWFSGGDLRFGLVVDLAIILGEVPSAVKTS